VRHFFNAYRSVGGGEADVKAVVRAAPRLGAAALCTALMAGAPEAEGGGGDAKKEEEGEGRCTAMSGAVEHELLLEVAIKAVGFQWS
jgi:hypothetical protein